MLDYLSTTLTTIEGQYPGCGIFLAGDFNRLNVIRLSTEFRMKQLIPPTRGDRILDLVLTNLPQIYDMNSVQILPPFGLSDHNVVLLHPKVRSPQEGPSRKVITKRDTRTSRKLELGRYLTTHFTDMCIPHFFLASERRSTADVRRRPGYKIWRLFKFLSILLSFKTRH
jgi:hypothetical protein